MLRAERRHLASSPDFDLVASLNLESSNQLFETLEEWNVTLSARLQRPSAEGAQLRQGLSSMRQ